MGKEYKGPVTDWKSKKLKIGWHIKNRRGRIAIVTWVSPSGNAVMYKLIDVEQKID
jgi:hypothetical protein